MIYNNIVKNSLPPKKKNMNILFLTISYLPNIKGHGIYNDLIRKFRDEGHHVYIVSSLERRLHKHTELVETDGVKILSVRILNIQRAHLVEKGISTLIISRIYKRAIQKHIGNVPFDLVLYPTPPITFNHVVRWVKRKNPHAVSYLLLKDIFPQNAVDLGIFGEKSLLHRYFQRKEKQLYKTSDYIGCMSPANVDYVRRNNPGYPQDCIEVAPNSFELTGNRPLSEDEKILIRQKYNLPIDSMIFVYGGNIGRPQGIGYLIQCIEANKNRSDCHFLIVGNGTEYRRLEAWINENHNKNVTLLKRLPKDDYDLLAQTCDVGLIFLDHRFTVPNYPSRLLTYLEYHKPVICATDPITDIGRIAEKNGFGFWCESLHELDFTMLVDRFVEHPELIPIMGEKGYQFLCENYTVQHTYDAIMRHFNSPSSSKGEEND